MLLFRLLAHFSLQWFDWTHYQENILVPPSFHLTQYDRLLVTVYDISTSLCPSSVISDVSSAYLVCVHAGESIQRPGIFLIKTWPLLSCRALESNVLIFIDTLNWYYARSIFNSWPINTNWAHNWWYVVFCRWYFSTFRWIWMHFGFACVPRRLRTDTPQGNIKKGAELTHNLLWNWTCVASALIDRWFCVSNFPAVCECLSLHDISRKPKSTNHLNTSTWFGHIGVNLQQGLELYKATWLIFENQCTTYDVGTRRP